MLLTYILANAVIIGGYLMLSVLVAPVTDFVKWYTKGAAIIFFMTCALHHFHNVEHAYLDNHYAKISTQSSHVIIDIVQAIAVWVFIVGLSKEIKYRRIPVKGAPN